MLSISSVVFPTELTANIQQHSAATPNVAPDLGFFQGIPVFCILRHRQNARGLALPGSSHICARAHQDTWHNMNLIISTKSCSTSLMHNVSSSKRVRFKSRGIQPKTTLLKLESYEHKDLNVWPRVVGGFLFEPSPLLAGTRSLFQQKQNCPKTHWIENCRTKIHTQKNTKKNTLNNKT